MRKSTSKSRSVAEITLAMSLIFLNSGLVPGQEARASEKVELWPYIEKAAVEDQSERKLEGLSYLVGGAVATTLPFIATSSGSNLRDVAMYTLFPAGIYSVIYGGYTLMTDSPWLKVKKRVEALSGVGEDTAQWRARRELHSRQALLERADDARFQRHLWGGVEAGAGLLLISSSRSAPSVIAASTLLGVSAYHFFYRKTEERLVEQLDQPVLGLSDHGQAYLGYAIHF